MPISRNHISFGLSGDPDKRRNSIGASDTRIIVNGDDEEVDRLWKLKRGEIEPSDLRASIYPQFGQYVEGFHCHWLSLRTELDIDKRGEEVVHSDWPGMHVTLDGWIDDLPPVEFADPDGDFKWSWGGTRPAGSISCPVELKWRNARQFSLGEQLTNFAPQLHQGMALSESSHAILSTLTSDLVIHAHVVEFDQFYWAQCALRVEDFREAVATGRPPTKFPRLSGPELRQVKVIRQEVDMMRTPQANMWRAFAQMALENVPTANEESRARALGKAKDQLKAMMDKDTGIARGAGVTARRNKAGAISFEFDERAVAEARAMSVSASEAA